MEVYKSGNGWSAGSNRIDAGWKIAFVEVKAPGEKMRALQIRRKQQLERVGFSVYCLDSLEQIRPILDEVGGETP